MGGYRPLPSELPRPFSSSWVSLSSILTLSRLALLRYDSFFFFSFLLSSGDAGNVSFVRGPVFAGSSNHLFPSSLGHIWLYTPSRFSPRVLTRNSFSQYVLLFSHIVPFLACLPSRLPSRPTSIRLFSTGVSYGRPALALEITPRFLAASRVHEWTRPNRSEVWRRQGVTEPGLSDLRTGRFGAHLSTTTKTRMRATTTPFDLASSTTPKIWTLGRQSYAAARD